MQISVVHSTVYHYDRPVFLEPHVIRLRPREDGTQRLVHHGLQISPDPKGRSVCLDQHGNVTLQVWFDGPQTDLAVNSSFQMETLRENPFDFLLPASRVLELPPT